MPLQSASLLDTGIELPAEPQMKSIFISSAGGMPERWQKAFPGAIQVAPENLVSSMAPHCIGWVRVPSGGNVSGILTAIRRLLPGMCLVVLGDEPSDEQALEAISCGASGYCNTHAAPEVLHQVSTVVANGGLWIGQALMHRLLGNAANLAGRHKATLADESEWKSLTERERQVARCVAAGATNKEVGRKLRISERTVKAHLGSAFEKLGVRDRLQLVLKISGMTHDR